MFHPAVLELVGIAVLLVQHVLSTTFRGCFLSYFPFKGMIL